MHDDQESKKMGFPSSPALWRLTREPMMTRAKLCRLVPTSLEARSDVCVLQLAEGVGCVEVPASIRQSACSEYSVLMQQCAARHACAGHVMHVELCPRQRRTLRCREFRKGVHWSSSRIPRRSAVYRSHGVFVCARRNSSFLLV